MCCLWAEYGYGENGYGVERKRKGGEERGKERKGWRKRGRGREQEPVSMLLIQGKLEEGKREGGFELLPGSLTPSIS